MRPSGVFVLGVVAAGALLAAHAPPSLAQPGPAPGLAPPSATAPAMVMTAPTAPPAPQEEAVPAPPSGQEKVMVWQPGRWAWRSGAWSWQVGAYVMRPSDAATWIPGRWEVQPSGGYIWIEGRWG